MCVCVSSRSLEFGNTSNLEFTATSISTVLWRGLVNSYSICSMRDRGHQSCALLPLIIAHCCTDNQKKIGVGTNVRILGMNRYQLLHTVK